MPVNTKSKAYEKAAPKWQRCRDTYEGSDSVKARGSSYLPPLDSHLSTNPLGYSAYLMRALFYNAVGRTVDGLSGGIFQKPPEFDVPPSSESFLNDVTLTGITAEMFALGNVREILITGRYGILIDVSNEAAPVGADRPYWSGYRAEDIVSWKSERQGGDQVLTRVVLSEELEVEDPRDPFVVKIETVYRVLELEAGIYKQTTYRANKDGKFEPAPLPGSGDDAVTVPERRGKPLGFIPFIFNSPMSTTPAVAKPPLEDLVDVNLSHYRTSADLEHGRHWTALPTPWVSGVKGDGKLSIGSGKAWELDKDGRAGMLEFTGQGLKALETADVQKRAMMATLGARLLETQPGTAETMGAVAMRHSGEHANLRTIASTTEEALTMALQITVWWSSTAATVGAKDWPDVPAEAKLNKDFFAVKMSEAELKAWIMALQADKVAYPTFYSALERGGLARPGVSAEEELKDIERFGELESASNAGGDISADDDDVAIAAPAAATRLEAGAELED